MKKIISLITSLVMVVSLVVFLPDIGMNKVYAAEQYLFPVSGDYRITGTYSTSHDGLDIAAALNTPIRATKSGTVVAVIDGDVPGRWIGYGKGVVIQHSDGLYSHYAHMNYTSVSQGQSVAQGDVIGGMGTTGNSTGVHLHFAVAANMYGAGDRINVNTDTISYIYNGGGGDPEGAELTEGAGETIPSGDYFIFSDVDKNFIVDISGTESPAPNGTNVAIWENKEVNPSTSWDVFHVEYLGNSFYKICQYNSNACLDVSSASKKAGANVHVWEYGGLTNQQWSIEKTSSGYKIRSRHNGYYLDVQGGIAENGRNISVWEGIDTAGQLFGFVPYSPEERSIADGCYKIKTKVDQNYYIDIEGKAGFYEKGANAVISSASDDQFDIKYEGNGYYSIKEKTSGLYLEITNADAYLNNSKNAQLWEKYDARGILWKIRKNSDGTYFLFNNTSGYTLDVAGGIASDGVNLQQFMYNGTDAQLWIFEPVKDNSKFALGDVNNDGNIDIEDAVQVIGHVNGIRALTDDEAKRADVDGSRNIDIEDAVAIISHVNGIKTIN